MSELNNIRLRIDQIDKMPAMPMMAQKILELHAKPERDVLALAKVIELDPSLSAQVIRYASSSLYGYRGKVDSPEAAISRVLGYDTVINLVLGIAVAKPFNLPHNGPLGLDAFWSHAVYSAILCQKLATAMPQSKRPAPGLAYLAGLLHNIGALVLGHIFPAEFDMLNSFLAANPHKHLTDSEREVFGESHDKVGAWLLHNWQLPPQLVMACLNHHEAQTSNPHAVYATICYVADHLLKRNNIGDAESGELAPHVLQSLNITEEIALELTQEVMDKAQDLEAIIKQFAA